MARQTEVVLLLFLATAATALVDFDHLVKAEERRVTKCPFGWVHFEGRCFSYQATFQDWASAEKHCLDLGAHLVSIHNEDEHQLVKSLIRAHDHQENPTWIGLNDCQTVFNFFWSDGTKLVYTKWNPNQPDFYKGVECCVHISSGYSKNWNDIPCHDIYPFVCTKSIK
ncbi:hypothetical protein AMELA_G00059370 [Ameiurus melas]|uniref:C-type lectin domain-containing protein n=1 Tax=Ameiurus melas TaxID=219545 RepID=A0A7J6B142_AMEME|nr:hypothetical protein AMELA_G00059370 [Ameiurus melas]